ncbi:HEAT repeat domain-containing protein [Streptomyces hirsutus]
MPALVARLDDPVTEVRYRAAELLACLGPSAAAHADAVVLLLGDTAARTTRAETVAEAALWALARMNDPRCLPGLADITAGSRSGFASTSAFFGSARDAFHIPASHPRRGTRSPAGPRRSAAAGNSRDRLGTATDIHVLQRSCDVLAAWGLVAQPAVPHLLDLLGDDKNWTAAAMVLARRFGRRAARGVNLVAGLNSISPAGFRFRPAELAAWAYWQVGGTRNRP